MLKRIITAAVALCVLVPVLYFSHTHALTALIVLCSLVGVWEMLGCIGVRKNLSVSIPSLMVAVVLPVLSRILQRDKFFEAALSISLVFVLYCLCASVFARKKVSVDETSLSFMSIFYIAIAFSAIILLRDIAVSGKYVYLIVFISAWVTDTFAYFTGMLLGRGGKHKLIVDVSPKKTVEGAIGGVVFCILSLVLYGFIASKVWNATPNYIALALTGLVLSVISQMGDLVMSLIKRKYGIKDYGKLFPGHGGILDRFDSILAVATALLVITNYVELFKI